MPGTQNRWTDASKNCIFAVMVTVASHSGLKRIFRSLAAGSAFVFFWSGGACLSRVIFPSIDRRRLSSDEKQRKYLDWLQWGFRAFWVYMNALDLGDFDHRKVEFEIPKGPFVMIANHPTLVDVTAILSVWGQMGCVVGSGYHRFSPVRHLMEACGHIDGGSGGVMSNALVVINGLEHLKQGRPVLIFPEGTRSPEHGLHPFQRGAFELANRAGVPVVPIFISADPPCLMKHQRWYEVPSRPLRLRLTPLGDKPPQVPEGKSKEVAEWYQQLYTRRLQDVLRELDRSKNLRDDELRV